MIQYARCTFQATPYFGTKPERCRNTAERAASTALESTARLILICATLLLCCRLCTEQQRLFDAVVSNECIKICPKDRRNDYYLSLKEIRHYVTLKFVPLPTLSDMTCALVI